MRALQGSQKAMALREGRGLTRKASREVQQAAVDEMAECLRPFHDDEIIRAILLAALEPAASADPRARVF